MVHCESKGSFGGVMQARNFPVRIFLSVSTSSTTQYDYSYTSQTVSDAYTSSESLDLRFMQSLNILSTGGVSKKSIFWYFIRSTIILTAQIRHHGITVTSVTRLSHLIPKSLSRVLSYTTNWTLPVSVNISCPHTIRNWSSSRSTRRIRDLENKTRILNNIGMGS